MADGDDIGDAMKPAAKKGRTAAKRVGTQVKVARAKLVDDLEDGAGEIEDRVESLGQEIATLAHQLERFAGHRLDDVRDMASEFGSAGEVAVRRAGQQTAAAARAVRQDPLPTVVALGVLALLAAFLISRANQR